ncbi:pyridoxal-phosphate dependent enzyme [Aestuariibacter salexigens]|uniref:pyridoxal-phosphate dependent enzyme n=1 Tax=Aestuariibacter salexigens TaxID=226010 RepID=UPI000407DD57|nr:pyridoxal-phosphate dependent enzyme [Aestuariibacter salexigens]
MTTTTSSLIQHIAKHTDRLASQGFYERALVQKTPLIHSEFLSQLCDADVWLKCENLQQTGSFKYRGAASALLAHLPATEVITASSGNHGAAVALAAQRLGVQASIYVPQSVSPSKEKKILQSGASLHKVSGGCEEAERIARQAATEQGVPYISPYNDTDVIAGQGSIATEVFDEQPNVSTVYISVGGGGLISGIGAWAQQHAPGASMVGCWPASAPVMLRCMQAGQVIDVVEQETLSDGTAGGLEPGTVTLPLCQTLIKRSIEVTEQQIAQAMSDIERYHDMRIEGAAGVAVASALADKDNITGQQVVIVLCGGNVTTQQFNQALPL